MPRRGVALDVAVEHEAGVGRCGPVEAGDDQERAAALELDVAGVDLDLGGIGPPARARAAEGRRARPGRRGSRSRPQER